MKIGSICHFMIIDLLRIKQDVSRYIPKRSCPSGGFCFYRLEEPSPQDTYFALATLELLQVPCAAEPTIRFLQALQQPDGGYASLVQTFYVLSSLQFLRCQPLSDPSAEAENFTMQMVDLALRPANASTSFCRALYQLATLHAIWGLGWHDIQRAAILQAIQSFRQKDGGFGIVRRRNPCGFTKNKLRSSRMSRHDDYMRVMAYASK